MKIRNNGGTALMQQILAQRGNSTANVDKNVKNTVKNGNDSDGDKDGSGKAASAGKNGQAAQQSAQASKSTEVAKIIQTSPASSVKPTATETAGYNNSAKSVDQRTASNKGEIVNITA